MDHIAFRDYSNVLTPLPSLGSDSGIPRSTSPSAASADFRSTLTDAVGRTSRGTQSSNSTVSGTQGTPETQKNEQLMKACRDLEGFMVGMLLRNMGTRMAGEGVFGQSFESSYYQDLFFSEIGRSLGSQGRVLGIADTLYRDIMSKEPGSI